jgi:16S rRNA (guanine527-N7)-methyltransferase|tara:strand:- start:538 stop:1152 length:615 start_codon:yes stop_codon:yes gene_type:complete
MQENEVIKILQEELKFDNESIDKLKLFSKNLLAANQKHNLIAKSTEVDIWHRHILDSAQLVKFIKFDNGSLADLGSGAGFPGIILSIYNKNDNFHVKLYEKSPVKRDFLRKVAEKLNLSITVLGNIYDEKLDSEVVVCRAFKKLDVIIQVSREISIKTHELIILKGENAQKDIDYSLKIKKYPYKLNRSMTNKESKIIIVQIQK